MMLPPDVTSEFTQKAKPEQHEPHGNPEKKSRAPDDDADDANGSRKQCLHGGHQLGDVFGHGLRPSKRGGVPLLAMRLR